MQFAGTTLLWQYRENAAVQSTVDQLWIGIVNNRCEGPTTTMMRSNQMKNQIAKRVILNLFQQGRHPC